MKNNTIYIYGIIIIAVVILGFQFNKQISDMFSRIFGIDTDRGGEDGGGEDGNPEKVKTKDGSTGANASIDKIKMIASAQFQAMDRLGTSDYIFDGLEELNGKALQGVYNQFGKIRYDKVFGTKGGMLYDDLDLFGWYENELSSSELTKMKKIWKKSNLWN